MSNLELKLTSPKDLAEIITIESDPENMTFIGAYSFERHQQVIDNKDELHLTFAANERLIGYAILMGLENPNNAIELKRITIAEKGKGYGRAAL